VWLYCPRCNSQTNTISHSRYNVFSYQRCGPRYRGIHAHPNKLWHGLVVSVNPVVSSLTETCCVYCGSTVCGCSNGWWPSVCASCGRDFPTDEPSAHVDEVLPEPSLLTKTADSLAFGTVDYDGCGPCTGCGYVFQMLFKNAVCPKCGQKMSREDAFFSCGSYPLSRPPENQ